MKFVTNQQMRTMDQLTISEYGIPGMILMETAGVSVVEEIVKEWPVESKGLVICGGGNNGGDGFVIARHLVNRGFDIVVVIIGDPARIEGDAKTNYEIAKKIQLPCLILENESTLMNLKKELMISDFVVDAIFGTGLKTEVHGLSIDIIDSMNKYGDYIYSVDIPSGINGDNATVLGRAIKANKTISFELPKLGNLLYPGADYNGELIIKPIGIPLSVQDKASSPYRIITEKMIIDGIPKRGRNSHKGSYGKAKVIACSSGMTGAAILTCKAALRSGLGLMTLFVTESLNHIIKTSIPEVITIPLQEMRKGVIGINHIEKIMKEAEGADVFTIGPGCGATAELKEIVRRAIMEFTKPLVLDADALNVLAKDLSMLKEKQCPIIMTPHIGEMARMMDVDVEVVENNPIKVSVDFAKEHQVFIVLKGARTVIATPSGEVYLNINGNSGMATAGSGDVLTGVITGLIAQGIKPKQAAITGVYIHGLTGDHVAEDVGEHGLLAGDLIDRLPYTMKGLVKK